MPMGGGKNVVTESYLQGRVAAGIWFGQIKE